MDRQHQIAELLEQYGHGRGVYSADNEPGNLIKNSNHIGHGKAVNGSVVIPKHSSVQIIRTVLKYSNVEDLKTCRLVHSVWTLEATKILLKHYLTHPIKLTTYGPDKGATLIIKGKHIHNDYPLYKFVDMVLRSTLFPCNNFSLLISSALSMSTRECLQQFFDDHGRHIKIIEFSEDYCEGDYVINNSNFEIQNLRMNLQNVETLLLSCESFIPYTLYNLHFVAEAFRITHNPNYPNGYKKSLPKLKTLDLRKIKVLTQQFLPLLLKLGTSLERIYCYLGNSVNLDLLKGYSALSLLKNFEFDFLYLEHPSRLKVYEDILLSGVQFERIESIKFKEESLHPQFLPRIYDMLYNCFCSSQLTLRSFTGIHLLQDFEERGYQISCLNFPNVVHLKCMCVGHGFELREFPTRPSLSKTLPHLTSVHFALNDTGSIRNCKPSDFKYNEIFKQLIPHETVRELSFHRCYDFDWTLSTIWTKYLCKMFPNLVRARFPALEEFNLGCQYIWMLNNLEELEFGIYLPFGIQHVKGAEIEGGFTGFANTTCYQLFKTIKGSPSKFNQDVDKIKSDSLRVTQSMLNLTSLKQLSIVFMQGRYDLPDLEYQTHLDYYGVPLSHVTGLFCFRMCPQLNINIDIVSNVRDVIPIYFAQIAPFVHSIKSTEFIREEEVYEDC